MLSPRFRFALIETVPLVFAGGLALFFLSLLGLRSASSAMVLGLAAIGVAVRFYGAMRAFESRVPDPFDPHGRC